MTKMITHFKTYSSVLQDNGRKKKIPIWKIETERVWSKRIEPWWAIAYPHSDLVRIRNGESIVVGIKNVVITDGDDVTLQILGNALGLTGFQLEPHWIHNASHQCRGEKKNTKNMNMIWIWHYGNGIFSIWDLFLYEIVINQNDKSCAELKTGKCIHN